MASTTPGKPKIVYNDPTMHTGPYSFEIYSFIPLKNGDIIILGTTRSRLSIAEQQQGDMDLFMAVFRISSSGELMWGKEYYLHTNDDDQHNNVFFLNFHTLYSTDQNDKHFIICGNLYGYSYDKDTLPVIYGYYLGKFNTRGELLRENVFFPSLSDTSRTKEFESSDFDAIGTPYIRKLQYDPSRGYLAVFKTIYGKFFFKFSDNLEIVWNRYLRDGILTRTCLASNITYSVDLRITETKGYNNEKEESLIFFSYVNCEYYCEKYQDCEICDHYREESEEEKTGTENLDFSCEFTNIYISSKDGSIHSVYPHMFHQTLHRNEYGEIYGLINHEFNSNEYSAIPYLYMNSKRARSIGYDFRNENILNQITEYVEEEDFIFQHEYGILSKIQHGTGQIIWRKVFLLKNETKDDKSSVIHDSQLFVDLNNKEKRVFIGGILEDEVYVGFKDIYFTKDMGDDEIRRVCEEKKLDCDFSNFRDPFHSVDIKVSKGYLFYLLELDYEGNFISKRISWEIGKNNQFFSGVRRKKENNNNNDYLQIILRRNEEWVKEDEKFIRSADGTRVLERLDIYIPHIIENEIINLDISSDTPEQSKEGCNIHNLLISENSKNLRPEDKKMINRFSFHEFPVLMEKVEDFDPNDLEDNFFHEMRLELFSDMGLDKRKFSPHFFSFSEEMELKILFGESELCNYVSFFSSGILILGFIVFLSVGYLFVMICSVGLVFLFWKLKLRKKRKDQKIVKENKNEQKSEEEDDDDSSESQESFDSSSESDNL